MKKLLRAIALLLLPLVLYTCLFLYLEPNNFYGLRAKTPSGAIFGALRLQRENPANAIIVGDSRLAHLSTDIAAEAAGVRFANLAYGGAGVAEQIELVEWMLEEYPGINTVVFGLSFYTLSDTHGQNRIGSVKDATRNPLLYLTNFSYHMEVLESIPAWLQGLPLYGGENETEDPAGYTYTAYHAPSGETPVLRTTVEKYLREAVEPVIASWRLDEPSVESLLALVEKCTGQGVRFVVVLPPMHPALKEYVVDYYGVTEAMLPVVAQLKESPAEVYDYEFTAIPDYPDEMFYDGLHLDYYHGLDDWTQEFFTLLDETRIVPTCPDYRVTYTTDEDGNTVAVLGE